MLPSVAEEYSSTLSLLPVPRVKIPCPHRAHHGFDGFQALLKEYSYWTRPPKQLSIRGSDGSGPYHLSQYHADWVLPRPESYTCEFCND